MIFDISIHKDKNPDDGIGISDILMKGISISWQGLDVETLRISVVIQSDNRQIKSFVSSDKVTVNVDQNNLTKLEYIDLTHLDLIGFYCTDHVLPEEFLNSLTTINQILVQSFRL